jgi:hypothetical protein
VLIAVLTLTLGIGANTAIFSVVKTVLLNPLPYDDPEQIVVLWETNPEGGLDQVSIPTFLDWQRETRSLGSVAAYRQTDLSYAGGDEPRDVPALRATPALFDVLAAGARVGRTFVAEEATMGANRVVVLSHGFWEESLGGRQGVVGMMPTTSWASCLPASSFRPRPRWNCGHRWRSIPTTRMVGRAGRDPSWWWVG